MAKLWSNYDRLKESSGTKKIYMGEMGWPSAGTPKDDNPDNLPCPGKAAQTMHRFTCEAAQRNVGYFYFSAFDSFWKTASHERYWGVFLNDRSDIKPYVTEALDCANSQFAGLTTDTSCVLTLGMGLVWLICVGAGPGDGGEVDVVGSGSEGLGGMADLVMSAVVGVLALF
jgi:hypothetical protein